jgi:hypothetical protein
VLGLIWDIGQVTMRIFDSLPFTPSGRFLRSFSLFLECPRPQLQSSSGCGRGDGSSRAGLTTMFIGDQA